jgi:hypothetical protein
MKRIALVVVAALAAACGGSTTSNTVTAPSTPSVTQTFTGTVAAGATDGSNTFTVTTQGPVTVTLTQAGPPASILVNLGIGTPGGGVCTLLSATTTPAGTTPQLTGTANAGTYCLSVQEFQGVGTITYTVVVSHT